MNPLYALRKYYQIKYTVEINRKGALLLPDQEVYSWRYGRNIKITKGFNNIYRRRLQYKLILQAGCNK